MARRDRLVVRTLRCGRSNPGSNPGPGIISCPFCSFSFHFQLKAAVFFLNFFFKKDSFYKVDVHN